MVNIAEYQVEILSNNKLMFSTSFNLILNHINITEQS